MKKLLCLIFLTAILAGTAFAQISKGGTAWISVKTATLKSGTGFFASNKGTLAYGDQVSVIQVTGSWAEIKSSANASITGWVNTSNLSAKKIVATGNTSSASASEVAHASKGFNQEVENEYKKGGGAVNFDAVDWTEKIIIKNEDLHSFITEGRLAGGN